MAMLTVAVCTVLGAGYHGFQRRLAGSAPAAGDAKFTFFEICEGWGVTDYNRTEVVGWRTWAMLVDQSSASEAFRSMSWYDFTNFEGVSLFTSFHEFMVGTETMLLAYGGIIIIPCVVAEMASPQDAPQVMSNCMRQISIYYVLVGLIGYFGFGEAVKCSSVPELFVDNWFLGTFENGQDIVFWLFGLMSTVCLFVKALATIPIVVWPLVRELKFLFFYFEGAPVELQLPWAFDRANRRRLYYRVFISFVVIACAGVFRYITYVATDVPPGTGRMIRDGLVQVMNLLPTLIMSFFFPAFVSLFAINRHWYLLQARAVRKEQLEQDEDEKNKCYMTPPNAVVVDYAGGSYFQHFTRTLVAMILSLGLILITMRFFVGDIEVMLTRAISYVWPLFVSP